MKINAARLEALLLEMLEKVRSGDSDWVTTCVLAQDGVQVQLKVTSDKSEFLGIVTTGVVERVCHDGPGFDDLVDQLKTAGVTIEGETTLRAKALSSGDWTEAVASMAQFGRKDGVRFLRKGTGAPTDEQLHTIVGGYPFTSAAHTKLIINIVGPQGDGGRPIE